MACASPSNVDVVSMHKEILRAIYVQIIIGFFAGLSSDDKKRVKRRFKRLPQSPLSLMIDD